MTDVSIPGVVASDVATGRRPRNRKATISKVAATLFAEQGFDVVRMDDIAAASGITVRALYRHFANKAALLTEIVETSQTRFLGAVGGVSPDVAPPDRFGVAVDRLALASEDTAHFAVLWQREARHLDADDFGRLRDRLVGMIATLSDMIGAAAPGLSPFQRELRAWAAIAVVVVPRTETDADSAVAAARTLLTAGPRSDLRIRSIDNAAIAADELVSRRERLLSSAAVRFARGGFAGTGIEDIGRAAGVSGPSLYRHFSSKNEILDTIVDRRAGWLWYETHSRWAPDQAPESRLRDATDAFIANAVRSPDLVSIWITEAAHVSEPVRTAVGLSLSAFYSTWSSVLQGARPDLTPLACTRLVRIATQVVEDTVRIRHLAVAPEFAAELATVVSSMLLRASVATA